ncbi:hypothetical protein ACQ4M4_07960 [Leptolyngbya sp. AN02str]|uniref:hypothetical protein n=1 Tax=Leptolyngbya sp. AN02str TaxID=3423363 RepID=UPI003D3224B0
MTGGRRRSPSSTAVTKDSIEQAAEFLKDLPEKPKELWSLREAIDQLQDTIKSALDRGYSHEEVSAMLTEQGIKISPSSLKSYLAATNREKSAGGTTRKRRTRGGQALPLEAVAQSLDNASKAEAAPPAPAKTGRTRGPRSTTAAKTKTAASRAKKTTATTATPRTRRKKADS